MSLNLAEQLDAHPFPVEPLDRMVDVLAIIATWPESYDQERYATDTNCGTSFCIGGWTAVRLGEPHAVIYDPSNRDTTRWLRALGRPAGSRLFAPTNSLSDVYRFAAEAHDITVADLEERVGKMRADRGWL